MGNTKSTSFPKGLIPFTKRRTFGKGGMKVNFLINYGWEWDLNELKSADEKKKNIYNNIHSNDISRIDLIIRWGGRTSIVMSQKRRWQCLTINRVKYIRCFHIHSDGG